MTIKYNKYENNLYPYFSLRYKNRDRNIITDRLEYSSFFNDILDKIFNTIIIVKNREEILDTKFKLFDNDQVAKEEISKLEYSLCSNVLHDLKKGCEIGYTIYFFKFNNLKEIYSFLKKVKEEKIQIEYYTTLKNNDIKMKKINKVTNIINDNSTNTNKWGIQTTNKIINENSKKPFIISKIITLFKSIFK